MLGMCFDKRILGGLAIVGVGVLVVAPGLMMTVLPLLLLAICPLSMLFMGKAMMGGSHRVQSGAAEPIDAAYRTGPALERDQEVALLQLRLQTMREQQTALAHQLAELQTPQAPLLPDSIRSNADEGASSVRATPAGAET